MTDTTRTEADAVAEIARDDQMIETIISGREERVYGRDAAGEVVRVDTVDLREDDDEPQHLRGTVNVHTTDALIAYGERHVDADASTLWGDVDNRLLTVVFNDHHNGTPGWADHRAVLRLNASPAWRDWTGHNEKGHSQEEFAEFLEEHISDITDPSGSTMLDVTRTFHATQGATFRRAQSLQSGAVELRYEEEVDAKAGQAGDVEVPREFTIVVAPFVGADKVEVSGQFRYRIQSGRLSLSYRLLNLEEILRDAVATELDVVADDLGLTAIEGRAPEARR